MPFTYKAVSPHYSQNPSATEREQKREKETLPFPKQKTRSFLRERSCTSASTHSLSLSIKQEISIL